MKRLCALTLTLFLAVTLGVGTGDTGKQAPQPQVPAVNKATHQNPVQAKKPGSNKTVKEPWPRTFVPSEKITADSVVSFPADI